MQYLLPKLMGMLVAFIACGELWGASLPKGPGKQVAVFIPLCDNEHQGIAPVPPGIGKGDDLTGNLYWGCGEALPKQLRASKSWQKPQAFREYDGRPAAVLEAQVCTHSDLSATLYIFAYRGDSIRSCQEDFEAALISGQYALVAFSGHNALMDYEAEEPQPNKDTAAADSIVLCCLSREYFEPRLQRLGSRPVLLTRQLMYPAGAVMLAAIEAWLHTPRDVSAIRAAAGKTYAANQRISQRAALSIFADLQK